MKIKKLMLSLFLLSLMVSCSMEKPILVISVFERRIEINVLNCENQVFEITYFIILENRHEPKDEDTGYEYSDSINLEDVDPGTHRIWVIAKSEDISLIEYKVFERILYPEEYYLLPEYDFDTLEVLSLHESGDREFNRFETISSNKECVHMAAVKVNWNYFSFHIGKWGNYTAGIDKSVGLPTVFKLTDILDAIELSISSHIQINLAYHSWADSNYKKPYFGIFDAATDEVISEFKFPSCYSSGNIIMDVTIPENCNLDDIYLVLTTGDWGASILFDIIPVY